MYKYLRWRLIVFLSKRVALEVVALTLKACFFRKLLEPEPRNDFPKTFSRARFAASV